MKWQRFVKKFQDKIWDLLFRDSQMSCWHNIQTDSVLEVTYEQVFQRALKSTIQLTQNSLDALQQTFLQRLVSYEFREKFTLEQRVAIILAVIELVDDCKTELTIPIITGEEEPVILQLPSGLKQSSSVNDLPVETAPPKHLLTGFQNYQQTYSQALSSISLSIASSCTLSSPVPPSNSN